jgi:hypothetical protein
MACQICDLKSANCDCTDGEKLIFGQLEDSEVEIKSLKHLLREAQNYLTIKKPNQFKLFVAITEALGLSDAE